MIFCFLSSRLCWLGFGHERRFDASLGKLLASIHNLSLGS